MRSVFLLFIGSTAVLLCACGGGSHPPAAIPTASLTASQTTVDVGNSVMLTWTSSNATSCTASGGWSGMLGANGSQSSGVLTGNAIFSITCAGAGGTSAPATATVNLNPPTVTLAALPTAAATGGTSTLTWSSSNADSCAASGGWSGTLSASGNQVTAPIVTTTVYSIVCTGPGGVSTPATATVTLIPAPSASLSAAASAVASGSASILSWNSNNATSCTGSGGWSGTLAPSGSQSTGPLTTATTYSLTCVGPGGLTVPVIVTISILPAPAVTLTATPAAIAAGGSATLMWTSTNASACTASGGWSGSVGINGNQSTGPVTSATSYALSCVGVGGTSPSAVAVVSIIPTATLSVTPSVIAPGSASTLTWTSTNAASCTASDGWTGALASNGSQSTGGVNSTTSYSLTCGGAGGTSSVVSAVLTVSNVVMSLAPQNAAITLTRTQQFTATVPGGGSATWTVDGIASGNATVGTITATGLYTAGSAGTHAIVATSVANTAQNASAVVSVTDLAGVYTYHNDVARDGANTQEYALTVANVNTATFGKLASCGVDGAIYGQPLWVANVVMGAAAHNVVLVTTQHDSLFAFDGDAISCTPLWSISLIDVAHGGVTGETSVPSTLVGTGAGDIQPEIGVNGTPVIDGSTGTLYVVSKSINAAQNTFYQRLHAIDITTGNEKAGSPVLIAGSFPGTGDGGTTVAFNAKQENQRAGLALVNGTVFIAWGSHEDSHPWYGWIMGYRYNAGVWIQTAAFNSTPNVHEGGIWMGGGAPSVDAGNNLYFLTGNGAFDAGSSSAPNNDYGDSLLQVNTALQVNSYFTPSDEASDFSGDRDFGSGGAAVLADLPAGNTVTHALVCGGKDGTLYVLNRDMLGGDAGDSAAVQLIAMGHGLFSTAAIWNNYLFAAGSGGPLAAFQLNTSTATFTPATSSSHAFGFPGATPSVSATATQNGLVWVLDTHAYCTHQSPTCGPAVLHVYDATNLAAELWNSGQVPSDAAGNAVKFSVPTIANGRVYVATRGNNVGGSDSSSGTPGELEIYGLTH